MSTIYEMSALNPVLLTVASRKVHANGVFDIPINFSTAIGDAIDVECRTNTVDHAIVFKFDRPIINAGSVTSLDSTAAPFGTPSLSIHENEVMVTIAGAPDIKRAAITLSGVNGSTNCSANIGFLIGDYNNSRGVSITDTNAIAARDGQTAANANFRGDVNLSGVIEGTAGAGADWLLASANSGTSI